MKIIVTRHKDKFQNYIHENKLSIKECMYINNLNSICGRFFRLHDLISTHYGEQITDIILL